MTTVKADAKGRLTGAAPGEQYTRKVDSEGVISYHPGKPDKYTSVWEVSADQVEAFFGSNIYEIVEGGIETCAYGGNHGKYYPNGIVVTRFVLDPEGHRVYHRGEAMREKVFIRILREETNEHSD